MKAATTPPIGALFICCSNCATGNPTLLIYVSIPIYADVAASGLSFDEHDAFSGQKYCMHYIINAELIVSALSLRPAVALVMYALIDM